MYQDGICPFILAGEARELDLPHTLEITQSELKETRRWPSVQSHHLPKLEHLCSSDGGLEHGTFPVELLYRSEHTEALSHLFGFSLPVL